MSSTSITEKEVRTLIQGKLSRYFGVLPQEASREQIYKAVWKEDEKYSSNTVQNTICRLRKKLEPDPHRPIYIKTIIGLGYKFELPDI